jgi:hypothetical protein
VTAPSASRRARVAPSTWIAPECTMNRRPLSIVALTVLCTLVACGGSKSPKGTGGNGGTPDGGAGAGAKGGAGGAGTGGLGGAAGVGGMHGSAGAGGGGGAAAGAGGTSTGGRGGPGGGGGAVVPDHHRAAAAACLPDRSPGSCPYPDGGPTTGVCVADSACPSSAGQTNGRCGPAPRLAACQCSYDTCFRDEDCALGGPCLCRTGATADGTAPNYCMKGNCQVDADCGPGGWCSPTEDFSCGRFSGTVGYYCHTPADTCVNDGECATAASPTANCRFNPTVGAWACASGQCAG